jgi:hypothetical protein
MSALLHQIESSQKTYAQTFAQLVDEQIEHSLAIRLQAIQEQTRDTVRDECLSAYASFGSGVETLLESRAREAQSGLQTLQAQIEDSAGRLAAMEASQREFAASLARVVEEQIEHTITLRFQAIHQQMREAARDEAVGACATLGARVETSVENRLHTFRKEVEISDHHIGELCARLEGHERNLLELVLSLGQRCMQAADWMLPPGASARSLSAGASGGGGAGFPSDPHIAPAVDPELPSFTRLKGPRHP